MLVRSLGIYVVQERRSYVENREARLFKTFRTRTDVNGERKVLIYFRISVFFYFVLSSLL
jgi:hypothetical protein